VSDARLLLFPVRSAGSVPFVWTTCPYLLERLRRDLEQTGAAQGKKLVEAIAESTRGLGDDKGRTSKDFPLDRALIEELEVPVDKKGVDGLAEELGTQFFGTRGLEYWRSLLAKILVVLPDGVFADLVLHCTEIVTRVRLSENKTVEEGALWTEEYAPADTLFYSVLGLESRRLAQKLKQNNSGAASPGEGGWKWVQDFVDRNPLAQFGGKETIGRGFFRLHLWPH
jgi:CRISPR-associated protein Cmr4